MKEFERVHAGRDRSQRHGKIEGALHQPPQHARLDIAGDDVVENRSAAGHELQLQQRLHIRQRRQAQGHEQALLPADAEAHGLREGQPLGGVGDVVESHRAAA